MMEEKNENADASEREHDCDKYGEGRHEGAFITASNRAKDYETVREDANECAEGHLSRAARHEVPEDAR